MGRWSSEVAYSHWWFNVVLTHKALEAETLVVLTLVCIEAHVGFPDQQTALAVEGEHGQTGTGGQPILE